MRRRAGKRVKQLSVPGIRQIGGALSVAYAQHWDNMAMVMMNTCVSKL
jgi:hypothetical protein